MRSVQEVYMYIEDRPTDRPTKDLTFGKIQMAISLQGVVRSTSCLVLPWDFRVGGSNGAISGVTTFNRYVGEKTMREE